MAEPNKNKALAEKMAANFGPSRVTVEAPKTGMSSMQITNPKKTSSTTQSPQQQTLGQITNMINTPWSYNPQTDAAAQSAIKAAERQMKKNQDTTFVDMMRRGIGNSSVSETIQNQIAGQTAENIANDIIPFYQQQAYQQHQDRIGNLGNLYSFQNQEYFQNPLQEAQLTGRYLPSTAQEAIRNILDLKRRAETPGITPVQLQGLTQQAQTYRDQLDSMGIDSSQFGADVNRQDSLANFARAGIPTLEAARMQEDIRRDDRDFEEDVRRYDQDFSESVHRFGVETALRQAGLEQDAKQFAQQMGYNWAQLNQRDKEFVADEVWRQKQYDLEVQRMNAPKDPQTGSLTANQFLDSMLELYSDPITNEFGTVTGTAVTTDPTKRKQLFDSVVFASYDDATTSQILNALGFTNQEIEKYLNAGK